MSIARDLQHIPAFSQSKWSHRCYRRGSSQLTFIRSWFIMWSVVANRGMIERNSNVLPQRDARHASYTFGQAW